MNSKNSTFQNASLVLSLIISLFLVIAIIPSQLPVLDTSKVGPESKEQKLAAIPDFVPFSEDAIEVKASGEEPQSAVDELKAFLNARDEFEKRFGNSFDAAWDYQERIPHEFKVPEGLEKQVDYWVHIFGKYHKYQYVFRHVDDVTVVYSAINLSQLNPELSGLSDSETQALINQYIYEEKVRIKKLVAKIQRKVHANKTLNKEEKRIFDDIKNSSQAKLEDSHEFRNISVQGGFAHRFKRAIEISGKYLEEMENIFSMKGLPVELTRIPFVESAFNITAMSSAKAAGLWQFIPETGRRYLKIDDFADERKDPILATYAAAQHLWNEYKLLGNWPMTINAYNTGPGRMLKARKQLQTNDIVNIIRNFQAPGYKFYSRNYFPEVLAAIHVYENRNLYFTDIKLEPRIRYDHFVPHSLVNLKEVVSNADVSMEVMHELNPALNKDVLAGKKPLPAGYLIRIPEKMGVVFAQAAEPAYEEMAESPWHVASRGETLKTIARRYGISITKLEKINQRNANERLNVGAIIKLPQFTGYAMEPSKNSKL